MFLIRLYRKKRHYFKSLDSYIKQAESEEKFGMHYTSMQTTFEDRNKGDNFIFFFRIFINNANYWVFHFQ